VFWNLHERTRGVFDFSGRLDLLRFCKLVQEHGMYLILRIGPYVCSETNYGGLPPWLRDEPGIQMRTFSEPFMREMGRWMHFLCDYLKPALAPNGGPIVLAQIENEYGNQTPRYGEDGQKYLRWVSELSTELNVGVPWVMCSGAAPGVLETINGFSAYNDIAKHRQNHPDQPAVWTEHWTGGTTRTATPATRGAPRRPPTPTPGSSHRAAPASTATCGTRARICNTNFRTQGWRSPSDLYINFQQERGNTGTLLRDLGPASDAAKTWQLTADISYEGNYENHGDTGGQYLEILDDAKRVLFRMYYVQVGYPNDSRLRANDQVLLQASGSARQSILGKFQPLRIAAADGQLTIDYAGKHATTRSLVDPAASWRRPKWLRFYFWNTNSAGYTRTIDIKNAAFQQE